MLQLAARVAGQRGGEADVARVLVRGHDPLDVILDLLRLGGGRGVGGHAVPEHDEGADNGAALGVRPAHDGGLQHVGVGVDGRLDLGAADVVARGDDHVVAPGLVVEVAVGVPVEHVAGDVPAVGDVARLPGVVQVAAAHRPDHAEPSRYAGAELGAVRPEDRAANARQRLPGRPGADGVADGGDEDVQHLGGADAVDDPQADAVAQALPGVLRDVLAGRHGRAQPGQLVLEAIAQHRLVRGRGGGQDRHLLAGDQAGQLGGSGLLDQQRARARPQREDDQHAEAEGEGERRGAGDHVVRCQPEGVAAERVVDRQDVPVEVHRDLRYPGAARRRGEQRHVVGRGGDVAERARLGGGPDGQVARSAAPVGDHREGRQDGVPHGAGILGEPVVNQSHARLGALDDRGEFAGAQRGHGGHHDAARLEHPEPGGDRPRVVRRAEQDALPGHEAEVLGEHLRDLIRPGPELTVGPGLAVRGAQRGPAGAECLGRNVDEFGGGVEPVRVGELRGGELDRGPQVRGRQVVAGEGVDVRRR